MAWKQILWPNLDNDPNNPLYVWIGGKILDDWCGWCLAVTAAAFGAQGSSYSAKTAWQSCPTKHYDRHIPQRIWTPLWYEGGEFGHVVFCYREDTKLTVYSTPCGQHIATFQIFSGELNWLLDYIGQIFGVGTFSGWSESVLDSRVMVWEDEPVTEPTPEPQPEPEPSNDNNNGKDDMTTPAQPIDQQLAGGLIEEAGEWFEPSKTAKLIAYLVGDALLVGAILIPDIINCMQAPNLSIFGEYLAKVLLEAGTCILMVFKLIKKKS